MGTIKKGRSAELLMMAMLIKNGFNVFEELADEEGIDCGVLAGNNTFYPIQIKSRAEFSEGDLVSVHNFRDNMFIIVYDEKSKDYWIIPADDFRKLSNIFKEKDGTDYYRLTVQKRKPLLLEDYRKEKGIQALREKMDSEP